MWLATSVAGAWGQTTVACAAAHHGGLSSCPSATGDGGRPWTAVCDGSCLSATGLVCLRRVLPVCDGATGGGRSPHAHLQAVHGRTGAVAHLLGLAAAVRGEGAAYAVKCMRLAAPFMSPRECGSVETDSEAPCPRSLKPHWRPPATTGEAAGGHVGGGL